MVIEISLDASIAGQALFRKPFLAAAGDIEDRLGHFAGIAQHVGRRDLHDVDAVTFLPAFARAILAMLLEDDMAVTDVAEPFAVSLAAISKHLTVLADAGLISQEKRGRVKWCKLEPDALREASVWMQGFGQMDGLDLDAFEQFLASEGVILAEEEAEQ